MHPVSENLSHQVSQDVLILTLRLDQASQDFFDGLRKEHFPPERNFVSAHLTLFHHLPDTQTTINTLSTVKQDIFILEATSLMNLGNGVAFRLESDILNHLHRHLTQQFREILIPQDRQGLRAHVTVQNKVPAEKAKKLLTELNIDFEPFSVKALGLDLWIYLGGPWKHKAYFPFT